MGIWSRSIVQVLYYDNTPAEIWEGCEVKIDDKEIVVEYSDAYGPVSYKGKNEGTGHFKLESQKSERRGEATLHGFIGAMRLVGYWKEGGYEGLWRIVLRE